MSTPSVLRPPEVNRGGVKLPSPRFAPGSSSSNFPISIPKMTCSSIASTSKRNNSSPSKKFHRRCQTFGASDSEIHVAKHKRRNRPRFRTTHPYEIDEKVKDRKYSLDLKNHPDDPQSTANHVRLAHQLRAPDNTTQFLMDDFEQRETERPCPIAPRLRCYSVCSGVFGTPPVVDVDASSDSELSCDEGEDNEFVQELDTVKLESIEGMSREQVNQSMLEAEKSNLHLLSRVNHLRVENNRLKSLLQQHGIEYKQDGESRSERSSNSDTSTVSNFDDGHEIPDTHPDAEEPSFGQPSGPAMHPTPPTNYD